MAKEEQTERDVLHVVTGGKSGEIPFFGADGVLHLPGDTVYAKPSEAKSGDNLEVADKAAAADHAVAQEQARAERDIPGMAPRIQPAPGLEKPLGVYDPGAPRPAEKP